MKNFLGAFADGAILFPLIAALSLQGALPVDHLLFTAGLAYLVSGWFFRIPMPVQPLKSIAIAAVAVHASGLEIRTSGAVLGCVCLILAVAVKNEKINTWIRAIPPFFIRALQTALGVILIMQGLKVLYPLSLLEQGASAAVLGALFFFSSLPLLGIFATLGLVAGVFLSATGHPVTWTERSSLLRVSMVASLVIPQIALTFANSVISTKQVAEHYFGKSADRVNEPNLFASIGIGNLIVALLGGLPYCHGAGGLTAHYRGGARTHHANYIIGFILLGFALVTHFGHSPALNYPLFLLSALLIAIGWFHFGLVRAQRVPGEKVKLILVGLVAAFTQNMMVPLLVTILLCLPYPRWIQRLKRASHDFV